MNCKQVVSVLRVALWVIFSFNYMVGPPYLSFQVGFWWAYFHYVPSLLARVAHCLDKTARWSQVRSSTPITYDWTPLYLGFISSFWLLSALLSVSWFLQVAIVVHMRWCTIRCLRGFQLFRVMLSWLNCLSQFHKMLIIPCAHSSHNDHVFMYIWHMAVVVDPDTISLSLATIP